MAPNEGSGGRASAPEVERPCNASPGSGTTAGAANIGQWGSSSPPSAAAVGSSRKRAGTPTSSAHADTPSILDVTAGGDDSWVVDMTVESLTGPPSPPPPPPTGQQEHEGGVIDLSMDDEDWTCEVVPLDGEGKSDFMAQEEEEREEGHGPSKKPRVAAQDRVPDLIEVDDDERDDEGEHPVAAHNLIERLGREMVKLRAEQQAALQPQLAALTQQCLSPPAAGDSGGGVGGGTAAGGGGGGAAGIGGYGGSGGAAVTGGDGDGDGSGGGGGGVGGTGTEEAKEDEKDRRIKELEGEYAYQEGYKTRLETEHNHNLAMLNDVKCVLKNAAKDKETTGKVLCLHVFGEASDKEVLAALAKDRMVEEKDITKGDLQRVDKAVDDMVRDVRIDVFERHNGVLGECTKDKKKYLKAEMMKVVVFREQLRKLIDAHPDHRPKRGLSNLRDLIIEKKREMEIHNPSGGYPDEVLWDKDTKSEMAPGACVKVLVTALQQAMRVNEELRKSRDAASNGDGGKPATRGSGRGGRGCGRGGRGGGRRGRGRGGAVQEKRDG